MIAKQQTIALLGATGLCGRQLLGKALKNGYAVRALVHQRAKLDIADERLEIVEGDALDEASIRRLVAGTAAIVSALGPRGFNKNIAKQMISSTATSHLIKAMHEADIKRYLVVSGAGVVLPTDKRDFRGWLLDKVGHLILGDVIRDKDKEATLLQQSNLTWTLIRCPQIVDEAYQRDVIVSTTTPPGMRVRVTELASFIIEQLNDPRYEAQGVFVASQ